jgi:hypothetical protein
MKRAPVALSAALLLCLAAPRPVISQGGAQVPAATQKQIAGRYARYDRLDAGRDVQSVLVWYLENTTGDYAERDPRGRVVHRADVIATMRSVAPLRARAGASGIRVRSRTAVRRLVRRGAGKPPTVVADTTVTVSATIPPRPGKPASTIQTRETHRDTWVQAGGGWRIKLREVLTRSTTSGGKPSAAGRTR